MSVTIKAYLLGKEDVHKEIRRFAVDEGVSTSFEYLKSKVVDVFSNLRNVGFQMYYRGEFSRLVNNWLIWLLFFCSVIVFLK